MDDSRGKQIVTAMKAIMKMQSDCIKLFEDLDKSLEGYDSFYSNVVTWGLGSSMSARHYLAEGLTRLYSRKGNSTEFLAINICFYDLADPLFVEPIFIAARVLYEPMPLDQGEKLKRGWDPWYGFLSWASERRYGETIVLRHPAKREVIDEITLVAEPLFNITSLEVAQNLIEMVGRPA